MYAPPPSLNLVVLRSRDLTHAERFYRAFGFFFVRHRHGTGPEHLAGGPMEGSTVLEIYPLRDGQPDTTAVRIGFRVDTVDVYIEKLIAAGGTLLTAPHDSEWGRRAVLRDPDGHIVELVCPEERGPVAQV